MSISPSATLYFITPAAVFEISAVHSPTFPLGFLNLI
jgi:hypothetical protein